MYAFDGDDERTSLFLNRSYTVERISGGGGCLLCSLDREPIVPDLPEGFTVGAVDDSDVASRVRAQQSAFDSTLTVAQYERMRRLPAYRRELDIGVKSPEGEVVAFCIVWLDEHNSLQYLILSVATKPINDGAWERSPCEKGCIVCGRWV